MTRQRLEYLFYRYTNHEISESEKAEFFQAVADADTDPELKQLIDQLWMSIPEKGSGHETAHIFRKIYKQIDTAPDRSGSVRWFAIAASISLLAIIGSAVYFTRNTSSDIKTVSEKSVNANPSNSFIRLPDGSTVVLNAGSFLNYPKSFEGQQSRIVKLEGEGYFDIQHDPDHPFIVISGNVVTTVLGTAFNVKAFPNDDEVTVTVTRGKVEVSSEKKLIGVLTHDQQITVKHGVVSKEQAIDTRTATAWMETDIAFDDTTLKEALEELERRFNVRIVLKDERAYKCRFTGTFVHGENVEQILLVVSEFNNVTLNQNRETGVYEISGAGCDQK